MSTPDFRPEIRSAIQAARDLDGEEDLSPRERKMRWIIRLLADRLKGANKTIGRQGETISTLRAEKAEALSLTGKVERGDIRRLERTNQVLQEELLKLNEEVKELRAAQREQEMA